MGPPLVAAFHESAHANRTGSASEINSDLSRAVEQHGRRWRSLVCAVTRNEWHLREWLLRSLYVGVSHIVLVDDNHDGLDQDISALLEPLIALGLVTHAPSARCGDQCVSQKS